MEGLQRTKESLERQVATLNKESQDAIDEANKFRDGLVMKRSLLDRDLREKKEQLEKEELEIKNAADQNVQAQDEVDSLTKKVDETLAIENKYGAEIALMIASD